MGDDAVRNRLMRLVRERRRLKALDKDCQVVNDLIDEQLDLLINPSEDRCTPQ